MKKFVKVFLIALCTLVFSGAFGQGGFVPVYVIPDLTTDFKVNVPAGSLVYVQSTDKFYNVLVAVGRTVNMTYVLEDATRYDDATVAALGSTLTITDSLIVPYVDATYKLIVNGQTAVQNNVNNIIWNNSLTATDTLFAPVIDATTKALIKLQELSQDNINRLDVNNSLQVNDTLFIGSAQYLFQTTVNRIKGEGSIQATDTLVGTVLDINGNGDISGTFTLGTQTLTPGLNQVLFNNTVKTTDSVITPVAYATTNVVSPTVTATTTLGIGLQTITQNNVNSASFNNSLSITDTITAPIIKSTTKFTIGSQSISQSHNNNATFNNSVTAADTVFGNVIVSSGNLSATGITGSTLPTFTIAAGTVTPVLLADTIGFAVSGLTTGAIVLVSPAAALATTDTVPYVKQVRTGWLTLGGKNGVAINYWIPKK